MSIKNPSSPTIFRRFIIGWDEKVWYPIEPSLQRLENSPEGIGSPKSSLSISFGLIQIDCFLSYGKVSADYFIRRSVAVHL